jgi:hypothetical protein
MSRQFAGSSVDPATDTEVWATAVGADLRGPGLEGVAEAILEAAKPMPTAQRAASRKTSRLIRLAGSESLFIRISLTTRIASTRMKTLYFIRCFLLAAGGSQSLANVKALRLPRSDPCALAMRSREMTLGAIRQMCVPDLGKWLHENDAVGLERLSNRRRGAPVARAAFGVG